MKLSRLAGLLAALACVGCGDSPRTIATARKLDEPPVEVAALVPAKAAPAQSDPAAKALIAEMLNAHTQGKPEAVKAFRTFETVRDGLVLSDTQEPMYQTWTMRGEWPGRYQIRADLSGRNSVVLSWSGDKAWRQLLNPTPGPAADLDATDTKALQTDTTGEWLLLLFPLLEPETVVGLEPAKLVRDKSCPGVRVWHPALTEAILYLDPVTKELAQLTFNGRESQQVVVKDFTPLELKETAGVRLPSRLAQNASGKQLADWTVTRLIPKAHDAKLFDKP